MGHHKLPKPDKSAILPDPPIRLLTPLWGVRWKPGDSCAVVAPDGNGGLACELRMGAFVCGFPVKLGDPEGEFAPDGRVLSIQRWGLTRIGAGVWAVQPSIAVREAGLAAYLVIRGVPEPAPFHPLAQQPPAPPEPPPTRLINEGVEIVR